MTGSDKDHADVVIYPLLLLALMFGLGILLEWLFPIVFLAPVYESKFQTGFSAIITLIGVAIAILGLLELRKNDANVDPHKPSTLIVSSGIFGLTRNPIYVGMIFCFFGVNMFWNLEWGVLLTVVVFLVLHYGVIKREEVYLEKKFGEPYTDYCQKTRRWL